MLASAASVSSAVAPRFEPTPARRLIGASAALGGVLELAHAVAQTDASVLITGESGTGKELVARAIHDASRRCGDRLITINCAAIPAGLLERELFGHERGAFTGAIGSQAGRFELADRGTLFLDEIGETPLELQPKLLRALEEREFERLGGTRTIRSDVRIIAATNRDLEARMEDGTFRADLWYRLNVFPIRVPPLRERPEDIPLLAWHFTRAFCQAMHRRIDAIPAGVMDALIRWQWPGNIRELRNVIERAVILTKGAPLTLCPGDLQSHPGGTTGSGLPKRAGGSTLEAMERAHILATLQATGWLVSGPQGAAALLGLSRSSLMLRMKRFGIARPTAATAEPLA